MLSNLELLLYLTVLLIFTGSGHAASSHNDKWTIGHSYRATEMRGYDNGSLEISADSLMTTFTDAARTSGNDFTVSIPTSRMELSHVFNVAYAYSNNLTIMTILPYRILSMTHGTWSETIGESTFAESTYGLLSDPPDIPSWIPLFPLVSIVYRDEDGNTIDVAVLWTWSGTLGSDTITWHGETAGPSSSSYDNYTFDVIMDNVDWNEIPGETISVEEAGDPEIIESTFTARSEGIGDLEIISRYTVYRSPQDKHVMTLHGGMSFPTGSTDERNDGYKLPYPLQLGSGTYDLKIGAKYQYVNNDWSIGADSLGTIRLGNNDDDYRLGNVLEISSWVTYGWTRWLDTTFRLDGKSWGNISGSDPEIDMLMLITPAADPNKQGGSRIDTVFDIKLHVLKGNTFNIEFGLPIYQNLDGPQLETDWTLSAGWQLEF